MCPLSTYAPETGALECEPCAEGKISTATRGGCEDCSAGQYVWNNSLCVDCEYGRYAPTAQGGGGCFDCGEGSFTRKEIAATSCEGCSGGTYSKGLAINCTACVAGKSSGSRASNCTQCDPGRFAKEQAPLCSACASGTYQEHAGASNCVNCTVGWYSGVTSSSICEPCSKGRNAMAVQLFKTKCDRRTNEYAALTREPKPKLEPVP